MVDISIVFCKGLPEGIKRHLFDLGKSSELLLVGQTKIHRVVIRHFFFRYQKHVWLVVYLPLWKILVSWDYYSQYSIWKNKKCSKPSSRCVVNFMANPENTDPVESWEFRSLPWIDSEEKPWILKRIRRLDDVRLGKSRIPIPSITSTIYFT